MLVSINTAMTVNGGFQHHGQSKRKGKKKNNKNRSNKQTEMLRAQQPGNQPTPTSSAVCRKTPVSTFRAGLQQSAATKTSHVGEQNCAEFICGS